MGAVNTVVNRDGRRSATTPTASAGPGASPARCRRPTRDAGAARRWRRRLGDRACGAAPGRRGWRSGRPRGPIARCGRGRRNAVVAAGRRPRTDAAATRCERRHRPDPRHAHRHGQAARPAAGRKNCCAPTCGSPRSSTSRSDGAAEGSAFRRRERHRRRRHHGRPGHRRLRAVHRRGRRGAASRRLPAPDCPERASA